MFYGKGISEMDSIHFRAAGGWPIAAASQPQKASAVRFGHGDHGVDPTGVNASAVATVEKMPDAVLMSAGISIHGKDQKAVQTELNQRSTALKKALQALDLPGQEIKSVRFSVQPHWVHPQRGESKQDGWDGVASYQVKAVDAVTENLPGYAAKLINTATDAGANQVGSPSFALSDPKKAAREAIDLAIAEAKADAEAAARAAGVKVGKIEYVNVQSAGGHYGGGMRAMAMSAMPESAGGGVDAEVFELVPIPVNSPTVSIRYAIDNKTGSRTKKS